MTAIPAADGRANRAMVDLLARGLLVQAVAVAARLRIADLVADGPRSAEELSAVVEADPDALARLLRTLAGLGVLVRDEDGRYGPTPLSRAIEDAPGSSREFALFAGEFLWEPWGRFRESIETGDSAFQSLHGVPVFEHLQRDPEDRAVFHAVMTANSRVQVPAVLEAYDFGRFETVVDVGGGQGGLLAALLRAHPGLTGILYDLPEVVADAESLRAGDVSDRARIESGDFFASVPAGGDCYLLKLVVHDWGDDQAARILSNVRAVIPADGTLLLAEHVVPSGTAYHHSMFLDLNMLVLLGAGRERTPDEYAALLGRAGFTLTRVVATDSPLSLVEAAPAAQPA